MKILDSHTDYLISQNKYATSTGLSSLLEGSISHDKITRFLNREELSGKDLWLYVNHYRLKAVASITLAKRINEMKCTSQDLILQTL